MARHRPDPGDHGVPVHLPSALWHRIRSHIEGTPFPTVDVFVAYAVRETLAREEGQQSTGLSAEEEERVKARLKALGYLE